MSYDNPLRPRPPFPRSSIFSSICPPLHSPPHSVFPLLPPPPPTPPPPRPSLLLLQVDSLRTMLLGMVNDPRVVLIRRPTFPSSPPIFSLPSSPSPGWLPLVMVTP
ncbi:unnamed protein product [Closterium sp. NIES-54]